MHRDSILTGLNRYSGLHKPPDGSSPSALRTDLRVAFVPTCAPTACALHWSASTSRAPPPSAKMAEEAASLRHRYGRLPYRSLLREQWGTAQRSCRSRDREGAAGIPRRSARVFRGGGTDATEESRVSEPNSPPRPG
jgi:hypothetical protein